MFDRKHDNRIKMAGFRAPPLRIIGPGIIFYVDELTYFPTIAPLRRS